VTGVPELAESRAATSAPLTKLAPHSLGVEFMGANGVRLKRQHKKRRPPTFALTHSEVMVQLKV
jgi:hypothetical protein